MPGMCTEQYFKDFSLLDVFKTDRYFIFFTSKIDKQIDQCLFMVNIAKIEKYTLDYFLLDHTINIFTGQVYDYNSIEFPYFFLQWYFEIKQRMNDNSIFKYSFIQIPYSLFLPTTLFINQNCEYIQNCLYFLLKTILLHIRNQALQVSPHFVHKLSLKMKFRDIIPDYIEQVCQTNDGAFELLRAIGLLIVEEIHYGGSYVY